MESEKKRRSDYNSATISAMIYLKQFCLFLERVSSFFAITANFVSFIIKLTA